MPWIFAKPYLYCIVKMETLAITLIGSGQPIIPI